MKRKHTLFKLIAILLGILIGLSVAEVGFRIFHFFKNHNLEDVASEKRAPINLPQKELTLGQVIQLSQHKNIIYELIPSSTYLFQKVLVKTNESGFRDNNVAASTSKKKVRIIGLGDSVMFGWGVEEDDCYLNKLEENLNENDTSQFEIVNTAVPGYNTVMEVATLAHKIDLTQIDLVVINFVGNDFDLPNFIRKKPDYFGIKKSFILQHFENSNNSDKRLGHAPFDPENQRYFNNPETVPDEYREIVGEEAYVKAMHHLKNMSIEYGFKVIVLSHSPFITIPAIVKEVCEKYAFELVDVKPFWKEYKRKNKKGKWKISEFDWHPTVEGHAVIALALQKKIEE